MRTSRIAATALLTAALVGATVALPAAEARRPSQEKPKPDLQIEIENTAPTAKVGTPYSVGVEVRNHQRNSAFVGTTTTKVYVSRNATVGGGDVALGTIAQGNLGIYGVDSSGKKFPVFPASLGTGTRYVIACADTTKKITESNESNNCFAKKITVKPADPVKPTIAVTAGQSAAEGGPGAGGTLLFTVTLDKATTVPVTFTFNVYGNTAPAVFPDDIDITFRDFTIAPGATSIQVPVAITGDATPEADEIAIASIYQATNATVLQPQPIITATVTNDD